MISPFILTKRKEYAVFKLDPVLTRCKENHITFLLENFSSLDVYFGLKESGTFYLITDASLIALAKIFEQLEFLGLEDVDVSLTDNGNFYFFRCVDALNKPPPHFFSIQNLFFDLKKKIFIDNFNIYHDLRNKKLTMLEKSSPTWKTVMDAAHLQARYDCKVNRIDLKPNPFSPPPSLLAQRLILSNILRSEYSAQGLELLLESGFIQEFWPEIYKMLSIPQMKDYHPEGNVWEHALECLKHRKLQDITLSLAILLHDLGKTVAQGDKLKPYHNHTELGASLSYHFLKRLLLLLIR
jgi:poly(A) polymerase